MKYIIPTKPHEVTIQEVYRWLLDVEPLKPKELDELGEETDPTKQKQIVDGWNDSFLNGELRLFLETNLCFWSSISPAVAARFDLMELIGVYEDTNKAIYSAPKYVYKEVLKIKGELYSLPSRYMQDSILFQYAECDQREDNIIKQKQNILYLLPQLMAVLLRKDKEPKFMLDKQLNDRIEGFKGATMAQAWQVFAYYQETKEAIRAKFGKTLYGTASSRERKAGVKGLQDAYGWLLTIKRLAEKKIFDISGYNSQDSVLRTPTWECLTHLSADNAINSYQERLYKQE